MRKLDRELRDISRTTKADPMRLQSVLAEYLETGRLLGPGHMSAETLSEVTGFAARTSVALQDDSLFEAVSELHRIQGETGAQ